MITAEEARPGDHGFRLEDIANHVVLNDDELQAVQWIAEIYRRRHHKNAKPFWVSRRVALENLSIAPDLALADRVTRQLVEDTIRSDNEFVKRYLNPTAHEALASSRRFVATKAEAEINFWKHGHDPRYLDPNYKVKS